MKKTLFVWKKGSIEAWMDNEPANETKQQPTIEDNDGDDDVIHQH